MAGGSIVAGHTILSIRWLGSCLVLKYYESQVQNVFVAIFRSCSVFIYFHVADVAQSCVTEGTFYMVSR